MSVTIIKMKYNLVIKQIILFNILFQNNDDIILFITLVE